MSYCSENKIPADVSLGRVIEVIELLGYIKVRNPLKTKVQVAFYVWNGDKKSISFAGIELYIYKYADCISVQTRTSIGRSYWDLKHQNKTISLIRSLFGGSFTTDEGNNRYMSFDCPEPSKLACSLYLSRWRLKNALQRPTAYLDSRNVNHDLVHGEFIKARWLDDLNPILLSNNSLIPYIIGCWESYFRQLFVSIIIYADSIPEQALKNCRLSGFELLQAARDPDQLVWRLADSLSFQRPGIIAENFRRLNSSIDIGAWLRKPYHRRKKSLFESISEIIDLRDAIVHAGITSCTLSDNEIRRILFDLTEAANRVYDGLGKVYGFIPDYRF